MSTNTSGHSADIVPNEGGRIYTTVGASLTVVVVCGLAWGLVQTAIKAVAIFTG